MRVAGLGDRLLWAGVGLLVAGNLAVMESGSARLDLTQNALRVTVSEVPAYLFGGSDPGGQLWLLLALSVILVMAVTRLAWDPASAVRVQRGSGLAGFVFGGSAIVGVVLGAVWLVEPVAMRGAVLQFVMLLFPFWALGWVPWRAIGVVQGPDGNLMQLTMVSVTSLLVFVVLWYLVMASGAWGFADGAHWSAVLTFFAPVGLLVGLAGMISRGPRWRA